ncbi:SAV_2336 N-terminal domain-related protein [Streptomyces sp. NPDC001348]
MSEALERLVRALGMAPLPRGVDARTLADALWLAASGAGEGTTAAPAPVAEPVPAEVPDRAEPAGGRTPRGTGAVSAPSRTSRELSLRRPGADTTVRGVPLSLGRAGALQDALAIGRAIQPFRRPWRHGGRSRLDIEATVEHYARGGPLVPLFRPAPEPWFEAVLLVDTSVSMGVWEETTRALTRLLTSLGGFRAVHTWRLEWRGTEPRVRDHNGHEVPGERVPHHGSGTQGRRLTLVVSDCAARGWHEPAPWMLLRAWGELIPLALLDPLPPRLWRRSALNLPAVRVTCDRAGDRNGALRFTLPPRLGRRADGADGAGPWTALPVVSCTARSLGAWASTLMRADPGGCDAVLVPATGRLSTARQGSAATRQHDPTLLADAFVHTAPAPAVRLAVLCSGLPDLPLPLLHVLRDEAVPEAGYSDLAEVLTSGLFTVRRDGGDPVLVLRPPARARLRTHLTTHDEWRTRAAFSRHAAAHPYAPQGIAAVLHAAWGATELPAEERPFAETVTEPGREVRAGRDRKAASDSGSPAAARPPVPGGSSSAAVSGRSDGASAVYRRAREEVRSFLGTARESSGLQDAETLLRHLVDYLHDSLPAPLGGRPGRDTSFDDLRVERGPLATTDVLDHVRAYLLLRNIALELPAPGDGADGMLVWRAPGGPVHVAVRIPSSFSWSRATALAKAMQRAPDSSPVDFALVLDESDKPEGLLPLDTCVLPAPRVAPEQMRLTVLLRAQARYGRGTGDDARTALAEALRELYTRAGFPTYSALVGMAARESPPVQLSTGTLTEWFTGRSVPADERAFEWLLRHLTRRTGAEADDGRSPFRFAALRHHALVQERREGGGESRSGAGRLGRPVAQFVRETEEAFPPYTDRPHDRSLRNVVRACATGASRMVLLVGPPGSGRTRSSLEAVRLLPDDWLLWAPHAGDDLAAALDTPASIGPRTVLWLDDADDHLLGLGGGGRGERIAAGLRTLLRDAGAGPVLVLGSLRTDRWHVLTSTPPAGAADPHPQARALCDEGIPLLVLPGDEPGNASGTAATGLEIEGYVSGSAAVRAVVNAAIDARRCGHGPLMTGALLARAAEGYLPGHVSPSALEHLAAEALDGAGLYGTGPLVGTDDVYSGPVYYRLSAGMERYGRELRRDVAPPGSLWTALAAHASSEDLLSVARTARRQGDTLRAEHFQALAEPAPPKQAASISHEATAAGLRRLLQRTDLTEAQARAAVDQALKWLRADDRTDSAQFVLNGLLPRTGLTPEQVAEAVQHAFRWLAEHGDAQNAGFVLTPLLALTDLPVYEARRAVEYAVDWLEAHGDGAPVQFVLRSALLRADLSEQQARVVVARALNWLDSYRESPHSQFLLSAALRRQDLAPEARTRFVRGGIDWLGSVGTDASAKFVLRPLLHRNDLTAEEAREGMMLALAWLETHGATLDAQFVLNGVLSRDDLTPAQSTAAVTGALRWLRPHATADEAMFVLRPLLKRADLTAEEAREGVMLALAWLETHGATLDAQFVLNGVLSRDDLTPAQSTEVVARALQWLRTHAVASDAGFVLPALLDRPDLGAEQAQEAGRLALVWLDARGGDRSAGLVLRRALRRTDLGPELSARALKVATQRSRARGQADEQAEAVRDPGREPAAAADHGWRSVVLVARFVDFGRDGDEGRAAARHALLREFLLLALGDRLGPAPRFLDVGDAVAVQAFLDETRRADLILDLAAHMEATLYSYQVPLGLRVALRHGEAFASRAQEWRDQALKACRLVDSAPLRAALAAASRSSAAVLVSDELFGAAFRTPNRRTGTFSPVWLGTEEGVVKAWISVPGYPAPPGIEEWARPPGDDAP